MLTFSHFHLDKLLDKCKVNTLKHVQDKHQQDHSLDFTIANYVYHEKWHKIQAAMTSNPNIMYTIEANTITMYQNNNSIKREKFKLAQHHFVEKTTLAKARY